MIYLHHGAALITAREKRKAFGEEREYLILQTAHGDLTLSVPADMADSVGMRPPIDEDDVEDLFELLAKKIYVSRRTGVAGLKITKRS